MYVFSSFSCLPLVYCCNKRSNNNNLNLIKMKNLILAAVFALMGSTGFSQNQVYVQGYYKSNGTYVQGHYRTAPDSNPCNNYSYPGNYNPNTGSYTTGSQTTYLNNYYNNSSSSSSSYSTYTYPTNTYTTPTYTPTYNYTPTYTYTTPTYYYSY